MAKLTAAQERSIETVLYHLKRANSYLLQENVFLGVRKDRATTTLDYSNIIGKAVTAVDKEIGSDIAGLSMAIQYLENFSKMNSKDYKPGQEE
jgi:hypothetical protein